MIFEQVADESGASTRRTPKALLFSERGLGGSEAGDRNPERTAADIIQSEAVTEFYAVWFAAVLTANSQFDLRTRFAAEVTGHLH